ncbi:uncharacterized protein LOC134542080 [Bacillus rossius redtenbacheri]|uniref:uncharacterized protein LOC134542080 n=1 Tax=Bacillus rossius redtenbacheri TaxID=93214 RepID=UPI002FDE2C23
MAIGSKSSRDGLVAGCATCDGGTAGDSPASSEPGATPARKAVGLTKVRLEDCLRCDACSCIYLDQSDYDKHMNNFHRHDSPKKLRQRRGCRSCCRHCNCRGDHQHQGVRKERGNNNLFHYNIKDRWTKMLSRRLQPGEVKREVKPDPDDCPSVDLSHLLSQVEVKIKTEPLEQQEAGQ